MGDNGVDRIIFEDIFFSDIERKRKKLTTLTLNLNVGKFIVAIFLLPRSFRFQNDAPVNSHQTRIISLDGGAASGNNFHPVFHDGTWELIEGGDRGEKDSPTKPVTSRMLARQPRKIEPSAFISAPVYDRAFGAPPSIFEDIIRGLYAAEHTPLPRHSCTRRVKTEASICWRRTPLLPSPSPSTRGNTLPTTTSPYRVSRRFLLRRGGEENKARTPRRKIPRWWNFAVGVFKLVGWRGVDRSESESFIPSAIFLLFFS